MSKADANAVLEMAMSGKQASQMYEGERKFSNRVRYLIHRDDNQRFAAVKFRIRGRDMGSTIEEAQKKVHAKVSLPKGYTMKWTGDFENQRYATQRLTQVVPVSLGLIFFILFSNLKDAGLVLLNVPIAIIDGIAALPITHTNFSICRYRVHCVVRYLHPKGRDSDIGVQAEHGAQDEPQQQHPRRRNQPRPPGSHDGPHGPSPLIFEKAYRAECTHYGSDPLLHLERHEHRC